MTRRKNNEFARDTPVTALTSRCMCLATRCQHSCFFIPVDLLPPTFTQPSPPICAFAPPTHWSTRALLTTQTSALTHARSWLRLSAARHSACFFILLYDALSILHLRSSQSIHSSDCDGSRVLACQCHIRVASLGHSEGWVFTALSFRWARTV